MLRISFKERKPRHGSLYPGFTGEYSERYIQKLMRSKKAYSKEIYERNIYMDFRLLHPGYLVTEGMDP
jgi:hypothetical protein